MAEKERGFFGALFDLSLSEFITPKIIKVLYIIAIVLAGLSAVGVLAGTMNVGGGAVLVGLIAAPVIFFMSVLFARVWLETLLVLFAIDAEYPQTRKARNRRAGRPVAGAS